MRIGHRPQRRLANRPAVHLPANRSGERRVVPGRELHHQIVGMLPIVNRLSIAPLAAREQVRIPTAADRPRFRAEHSTNHHASAAHCSLSHPHHPVDAAELIAAAIARLVQELQERVLVQHHLPIASLPVKGVHGRRVGEPGCPRTVADHPLIVSRTIRFLRRHLMLVWLFCDRLRRRTLHACRTERSDPEKPNLHGPLQCSCGPSGPPDFELIASGQVGAKFGEVIEPESATGVRDDYRSGRICRSPTARGWTDRFHGRFRASTMRTLARLGDHGVENAAGAGQLTLHGGWRRRWRHRGRMMMMMMRDVLYGCAGTRSIAELPCDRRRHDDRREHERKRPSNHSRISISNRDLGCWRRPARRLACSSALVTKRSTERNVNVTRGPETSSVNHLRRLNGKSLDRPPLVSDALGSRRWRRHHGDALRRPARRRSTSRSARPRPEPGLRSAVPAIDQTTGLPCCSCRADFRYLSFGWTGDMMSDGIATPSSHDGMAAFDAGHGRVRLIRNHEVGDGPDAFAPSLAYDPQAGGGTTTLEFDTLRGELVGSWASISGTVRNCAGGPTPWASWLTCEETTLGVGDRAISPRTMATSSKCPVDGTAVPTPYKAMGRFSHEAVAVDPATGWVYETEDAGGTSGFYRFRPTSRARWQTAGHSRCSA